MAEKRSKIVYKNAIITITTQILQVILAFVVRKIFISTLGVSYLGYNSVFSNLLQMLNLADLGIGVAITSYLYLPLAEGDNSKVGSLMHLYRKIYSLLGICVLIIGLIISIFLPKIINDAQCSNAYLRLLFYINLAGTVSTYYLGYYRTLLIADQKSYTTSLIDISSYFIVSILQIIFLNIYPNYIVYLLLNVCKNIVSNIIISVNVHKNYGNIENNYNDQIINNYKPQIISYVKDVFVSRIGATVFYSTDNVIISIFKGSLLAGYYSNYTMVTVQVQNLITSLLSSIQATFGNYLVTNNDKDKRKNMTQNYLCANFIVGNIVLICIVCLLQPFIKLFFGEKMLLSASTPILLGINLMLTIMLQLPSQIFQIFKLFKYDKVIIAVSASLNIIISVALVGNFGVDGCLFGTLVTSLIYIFSRFYIISKKVFNDKFISYVFAIVKYFAASTVTCCVVYFINLHIYDSSIIVFLIHAILVFAESVILTLFSVYHTREFKFLYITLIKEHIHKKIKPFALKCIAVILLITLLLFSTFLSIRGGYNSYKPELSNKSLNRNDSYVIDNENYYEKKIFHLSIDDTIDVFEDIYKNEYDSIFDNSTLAWLKKLHNKYGTCVTMYVFYQNNEFKLSEFPNTYHCEFQQNSDWLKFGFHSYDSETIYNSTSRDLSNDYKLVTNELIRIAGADSIDNVLRLASFQGTQEEISQLEDDNINEPIVGLLTADDDRTSYDLDKENNTYIYSHDYLIYNNTLYISTDLRIEFIKNISNKIKEIKNSSSWNNQRNIMEVFTHEWELNYDNLNKISDICKWMNDQSYSNGFIENYIH